MTKTEAAHKLIAWALKAQRRIDATKRRLKKWSLLVRLFHPRFKRIRARLMKAEHARAMATAMALHYMRAAKWERRRKAR